MKIVLDYDSNTILSQLIPSRSQQRLLQACSKIHDKVKTAGYNPAFVKLDNEASKSLQQFMNKEKLEVLACSPTQSSLQLCRKNHRHMERPLYWRSYKR